MGKEIPDWIISCFWNHLDEEIYTVHETYTLLKWTMKTKNRVMRIKCPFLMPTTSQKLIEMSFSQNFWYWWWIFDKTGVFNLVYHLTAWGNRSLVHFLLWPLQQRFKFRFNFLIVLHFTVQFVIGDFWSRVVLKSSFFLFQSCKSQVLKLIFTGKWSQKKGNRFPATQKRKFYHEDYYQFSRLFLRFSQCYQNG